MDTLKPNLNRVQETALIGLESSLTSSVAFAQIIGLSHVVDVLLRLKRDLAAFRLNRDTRHEIGVAA